MREPEPVTGVPRQAHRVRRATGLLDIRASRIDPEPERDPDRLRPRLQQRDSTVDTPAHGHRGPLRIRRRAKHRPDRRRQRLDRQRLASHSRCLEEAQPAQRLVQTVRIRLDDAIPAQAQAHRRPLAAERRISEDRSHTVRLAERDFRARPPRPICAGADCNAPSHTPLEPRKTTTVSPSHPKEQTRRPR